MSTYGIGRDILVSLYISDIFINYGCSIADITQVKMSPVYWLLAPKLCYWLRCVWTPDVSILISSLQLFGYNVFFHLNPHWMMPPLWVSSFIVKAVRLSISADYLISDRLLIVIKESPSKLAFQTLACHRFLAFLDSYVQSHSMQVPMMHFHFDNLNDKVTMA